jgi:hypothetical protein
MQLIYAADGDFLLVCASPDGIAHLLYNSRDLVKALDQ